MTRPTLLVLALAAASLGCAPITGGTVCTDIAVPGLRVTVTDSVTGAPDGRGARILATDGTFVDSARTGSDGPYMLAFERTGTYTVRVEQAGYQPWSLAGVPVTKEDECHVRTTSVAARLRR